MFVLCLCMYQADDSKDEKKHTAAEMKAAIEETGRLTIENLMKIQAEKEAWIHTTNQIQINSNDFNLIQKKLNSKKFN